MYIKEFGELEDLRLRKLFLLPIHETDDSVLEKIKYISRSQQA